MRRLTAFPCGEDTLIGTLDTANGNTGLLIVSGGNEIRSGAHRGMALLAARLASVGYPVFRFDRRGIGDSTGTNGGYSSSAPDIAAAVAAFRRESDVSRIVAFGNCDAATALALFHAGIAIDALVLANPWAVAPVNGLPPPAAVRAHYARRLRDPGAWLSLLRGSIDISRVFSGLRSLLKKRSHESDGPAAALRRRLEGARIPVTILLARGDNTAIAFADAVDVTAMPVTVQSLDSASHSFAPPSDKDWLFTQIVKALA